PPMPSWSSGFVTRLLFRAESRHSPIIDVRHRSEAGWTPIGAATVRERLISGRGCRIRSLTAARKVCGISRHFSQTFGGDDVAHALMRAASALMPTPGDDRVSIPHQGVETSLDTARTSACATSLGHM